MPRELRDWTNARYFPVVVQKFMDGPRHIQAIRSWAVADGRQANSIVSRKFDSYDECADECMRLQKESRNG